MNVRTTQRVQLTGTLPVSNVSLGKLSVSYTTSEDYVTCLASHPNTKAFVIDKPNVPTFSAGFSEVCKRADEKVLGILGARLIDTWHVGMDVKKKIISGVVVV